MTEELDFIWRRVQDVMRDRLPPATFDLWIADLEPLRLDDTVLVVRAPPMARSWIAGRYGARLDAAAALVLGPGATVRLDDGAATHADPDAAPAVADLPTQLHPKLTFGQFVIGDANRLAHAAALAVAELPGQTYNPLFLCGPPGVGKTHLLHSIGAYVRAYAPEMRVEYTTVERFTTDFTTSVRGGRDAIDRFKSRYRRPDVLLVDDVQFLQDKVKTEEEFFHTFNAVLEAGCQLVLTSDRPPHDLDALHDRLRERFAAGLVADIGAPDLPTRMTILRKRVAHDAIAVETDDVIEQLALRFDTNVRALEGALIRVVAYASLTGRPLDAGLVGELLDGLHPRSLVPPARPTVADVQDLTCDAFSLTRDELLSPTRAARVVWPRQVAMYLARHHTGETLPQIGRSFGNRNHTTVMHAVKTIEHRRRTDPEADRAVAELQARLERSTGDGSDRAD